MEILAKRQKASSQSIRVLCVVARSYSLLLQFINAVSERDDLKTTHERFLKLPDHTLTTGSWIVTAVL